MSTLIATSWQDVEHDMELVVEGGDKLLLVIAGHDVELSGAKAEHLAELLDMGRSSLVAFDRAKDTPSRAAPGIDLPAMQAALRDAKDIDDRSVTDEAIAAQSDPAVRDRARKAVQAKRKDKRAEPDVDAPNLTPRPRDAEPIDPPFGDNKGTFDPVSATKANGATTPPPRGKIKIVEAAKIMGVSAYAARKRLDALGNVTMVKGQGRGGRVAVVDRVIAERLAKQ